MMMNLFSIFDPMTSSVFSLNWLSLFILLFLIPFYYYYLPSLHYYLYFKFMLVMFNEFLSVLKYSGSIMIFISLMYMILLINFMGLFPYIFTSTSHMVATVSFAIPIWLGGMLYGWYNYSLIMFSHLVPQGTPPFLMSFMVLIETISSLIRPLTLSVRLSANMIAGHLLLCLMGSLGPKLNVCFSMGLVILQIALYLLELGVSIIQAYVFSILCSLYISEVESLS